MKRKIHKRVEMVVDSIPGIMKSSTDDPDMPNIVKRGKDRAVDKARIAVHTSPLGRGLSLAGNLHRRPRARPGAAQSQKRASSRLPPRMGRSCLRHSPAQEDILADIGARSSKSEP